MNPEQIEHRIIETIRAECKRHGHGVTFAFDPEGGDTLHVTTTYDLNKRARMHEAVAGFLASFAIGMGVGAIIGELTHINVPCQGPLVLLTLGAAGWLHIAVLAQHRDTIESWLDYLHQVLWEEGYEISQRDERTVIGFRT